VLAAMMVGMKAEKLVDLMVEMMVVMKVAS
jgi:hypothetical protein